MTTLAANTGTKHPVPNIDDLYQPTHDELARQRFISVLRNHAKNDMRNAMKRDYHDRVAPRQAELHGREPKTAGEIEALMRDKLYYRYYSGIRYNAQEMMFLSAMDPVERALPEMIELARDIAERRPSGGSLDIDPDFETPGYLDAMDIHLAPGCFHSEYAEDDVAQGVMLAHGGRVSTGANIHRMADTGAVGRSIGYWLSQKYADFSPRRMLDIGTQSGKNLLPYLDVYPNVEAHGVDVSAPALRYGHARAEHLGKAIHFSQQRAESMRYPDGHFDLIVSSFFFHEIPFASTRQILKECFRLLSPGGIMAHMELPPSDRCDPWLNWYWDWDDQYNNEPFYAEFRAQHPTQLLTDAGFDATDEITTTVPSYAAANTPAYRQVVDGEQSAPLHGRGGWFFFGAIKGRNRDSA